MLIKRVIRLIFNRREKGPVKPSKVVRPGIRNRLKNTVLQHQPQNKKDLTSKTASPSQLYAD